MMENEDQNWIRKTLRIGRKTSLELKVLTPKEIEC